MRCGPTSQFCCSLHSLVVTDGSFQFSLKTLPVPLSTNLFRRLSENCLASPLVPDLVVDQPFSPAFRELGSNFEVKVFDRGLLLASPLVPDLVVSMG
ncbi:RNA polymerase [Musa troglodytarum]|uniref:RNA polymerase n=1 Tax=Musa troglodytarum TaxID=320322 RepID=A0A9E7L9H7_9LILI|nr:RNA polymerase [Musa troglodytarum]